MKHSKISKFYLKLIFSLVSKANNKQQEYLVKCNVGTLRITNSSWQMLSLGKLRQALAAIVKSQIEINSILEPIVENEINFILK